MKIGDRIKLLIGYGHCNWSVIHNNKLKYVSFGYDRENKRLSGCPYETCNQIEADIVDVESKIDFTAKIKYQTDKIGWIKISLVNGKWIGNYIQQDY